MANSLLSKREGLRALRLARSHPKDLKQLARLRADVTSRVLTLVSNSEQLKQSLGDRRHTILGGDLHVEQPGLNAVPEPQHAEVGIYDYDRNVLLSAIVDLRQGSVIRVEERTGLQPPPSAAERQEAEVLARQDKTISRKLSGKRVKAAVWPARESSIAEHPAFGHRVVDVFFWTDTKNPKPVGERVLVDLSERQVIKQ